jgi:hypothetical protein
VRLPHQLRKTDMKDNDQHALVKAAARRMCEHLAGKGVQVAHTQMLEALCAGLGVANWRTLRAALDAPRTVRPPQAPPAGLEQCWQVEAIYDDNDQQWSDEVSARTALEAAAMAKMERQTDCGLIIDVTSVSNAVGECVLSPDFYREALQFDSPRGALATVLQAAARLRERASRRQRAALDWLADCLHGLAHEEVLSELTGDEANERARARGKPVVFERDGESFCASEALGVLCEMLERAHGGVVAFERADPALAFTAYQVRAMVRYFGPVLDDPRCGGLAPRHA